MNMQNVVAANWKSILGVVVIVLAVVLLVLGRLGWYDAGILALLGVILV